MLLPSNVRSIRRVKCALASPVKARMVTSKSCVGSELLPATGMAEPRLRKSVMLRHVSESSAWSTQFMVTRCGAS